MKRVIVSESGAVGIVSGKGNDIMIINAQGKPEARVETIVEDKDLKSIDKIKKDALKEIRKAKDKLAQ